MQHSITPDALRFMTQEHEHLNSDAKALLDRAAVEIETLREAMDDISKQKMSEEMGDDQLEDADWEGGYNRLIEIARKSLQPIT